MASDDKPLAPDQQAIYDRVGDAIARGRDARNAQHEQTLARVERARAAVDRSRRPRSDENTLIEITEFAAYENRFGRRLRRSFGAVETALSRPMVTRPGSPEEEAKPEFRAEKKRLAGAWTPEIYLDNRKSQALVLAVSAVVVEHEAHGAAHRDNNMRAAVVHVLADAAVSVLVIIGLLLARAFGWLWMDPLAGMVGACVIASWSWGLVRDTGAILLDMVPDRRVAEGVRRAIEAGGDTLADLHLWRLGPGHLGAIVAVVTVQAARGPGHYRQLLARFPTLSHLTIEVRQVS